MPSWNADQYLKFADERTQPARDLLAHIHVEAPKQVIDLGCGPGNSTQLLWERWPAAGITGLDSSPAMIAAAEQAHPRHRWLAGDIAAWAGKGDAAFDIVFSNAALHWVADHETLYPAIFRHVAPGGAFAVQVPMNLDSPAQVAMRDLASTPAWAGLLPDEGVRNWSVHEREVYYDLLAPQASRIDIWETEYLHVMTDAAAIVEWYKGTGLRPYLEALPTDDDRAGFLADYGDRIAEDYLPRPDGRVLFPFRRFFLVAYR